MKILDKPVPPFKAPLKTALSLTLLLALLAPTRHFAEPKDGLVVAMAGHCYREHHSDATINAGSRP